MEITNRRILILILIGITGIIVVGILIYYANTLPPTLEEIHQETVASVPELTNKTLYFNSVFREYGTIRFAGIISIDNQNYIVFGCQGTKAGWNGYIPFNIGEKIQYAEDFAFSVIDYGNSWITIEVEE